MRGPTQYMPSHWRKILAYNPVTGEVKWKADAIGDNLSMGRGRAYSAIHANRKVGGVGGGGNLKFKYQGEWYSLARVVYQLHTGIILPRNAKIRYADGNGQNLRFDNLVCVMKQSKANNGMGIGG